MIRPIFHLLLKYLINYSGLKFQQGLPNIDIIYLFLKNRVSLFLLNLGLIPKNRFSSPTRDHLCNLLIDHLRIEYEYFLLLNLSKSFFGNKI